MRFFNNTENSSDPRNAFYGKDRQENNKGKQARVHERRNLVQESLQAHQDSDTHFKTPHKKR